MERAAPPPVVSVTTASMDSGWQNTGYSWYERGYHADWPATGLPAPEAIIVSDLATDHSYQLAPDYRTNNAFLVDANTGAEMRLLSGTAYTHLSFLFSGMHNGAQGVLGIRVHFEDGAAEVTTTPSLDWRQSGYAAYTAHGRVNVANFTFAQVNGDAPKLFTADMPITNVSSRITSVNFFHVSGIRTAVFAVAGRSQPGGAFNPIPVNGYNADMIVEAGATRPRWLAGVTTASMETGTVNTLLTWFEQGYAPGDPGAGLPPAGSVLTSVADPGHRFLMPASYEINNALLLEQGSPTGTLSVTTPTNVYALSLLTASAPGNTTNQVVVHYADGSSETNSLISPDWMSPSPAAWAAAGCVNLNNRTIDRPPTGGPRLFAVALPVSKSLSPVANVTLTVVDAAPGSHAAFFALSGQLEPATIRRALLTIRQTDAGAVLVESSEPGILESSLDLATDWTDEGPIDRRRTLPASIGRQFWRVRQAARPFASSIAPSGSSQSIPFGNGDKDAPSRPSTE